MDVGKQGFDDAGPPQREPVEAAPQHATGEESGIAGVLAREVAVHEIDRFVVATRLEQVVPEGREAGQLEWSLRCHPAGLLAALPRQSSASPNRAVSWEYEAGWRRAGGSSGRHPSLPAGRPRRPGGHAWGSHAGRERRAVLRGGGRQLLMQPPARP